MTSSLQPSTAFASAASRVFRRVMLRRWIQRLGRTAWPAIGVMAVMLAVLHFGFGIASPWLAAGLVSLWLAGCGISAWAERPDEYSALALWDRAAGRREAFASAWWFERQPAATAEQKKHIERNRDLLPAALPRLAGELPLQPGRGIWIALGAAAIGCMLPLILRSQIERQPLSEEQARAAAEQAAKIASLDPTKKNLAALDESQKKELEKLRQDLKQTAKELENSKGRDAREVLASLEKNARDAEKLADQLSGDDPWASDKLTAELRRQADTAELGDAVAAKNAAAAAKAADELAKKLKSAQLPPDARERIGETLQMAEMKAEPQDRQRAAGENVLAASDRMEEKKNNEAGAEFEKLAEKMREFSRREQAKKELEKLAQQLRESGGSIAGQQGGMTKLDAAGQQNQGQGGQQSPQVSQSSSQQGQGGQQQLSPPGLGQGQQQMMSQMPRQGSGQGQQLQMFSQPPGKGKQGEGKPMLVAPDPSKKGEKPDAILIGDQPPGGQPDMALQMPASGSGLPPGQGRAELNNDATEKKAAKNQSTVAAQSGSEGQSTVRSIEGGVKKEAASRSANEIAIEAIAAEESALDEAALPAARREQVRRYFTELRKRFEKQN